MKCEIFAKDSGRISKIVQKMWPYACSDCLVSSRWLSPLHQQRATVANVANKWLPARKRVNGHNLWNTLTTAQRMLFYQIAKKKVQDNYIPRISDCVKVDGISNWEQKCKAQHTNQPHTQASTERWSIYSKVLYFGTQSWNRKAAHAHMHSVDNHTNTAASLLAGLLAGL